MTDRIERTELAQQQFDGVVGMHAGHGIDADGLFADNPGLMRTASGLRIDPLDLQPADVNVTDIARSLSRQCRYNGHVAGFLSVARHSIWVAEWLQGAGADRRTQLCGLLHDAAEAYLGDMVRPLKHRPEMAVFRDADTRAEQAIAARFCLPHPWPQIVHDADQAVTRTELDVHRDDYGCGIAVSTYEDEFGLIRGSTTPQYVYDEAEFLALFEAIR